MSSRVLRNALLSSAVAGFLSVPAAMAAPSPVTDTFQVLALVQAECEIDSATDLDFGTVDFVNGNTGQSTITYRCTAGTAPTASLDWDVMTGGVSGQLDYNLYSDAGYSNDWDTTNTVSLPAAAGLSTAETVNVYGRITSTQATANTVQVGSYSDDVTVTLTF